MASGVLHLVPAARRLLRAQHVRRRCRRELPQVPRESGTRGEGAPRAPARQEDTTQKKKSAKHVHLMLDVFYDRHAGCMQSIDAGQHGVDAGLSGRRVLVLTTRCWQTYKIRSRNTFREPSIAENNTLFEFGSSN